MDQTTDRRLRVAFIHPDLGIGGAERLIVDAAVGLQRRGHEVEIFTSYHDPKHCFEPTRDGTLKVHHMRTYIPRSLLGMFHSIFAILQHFSLVFQLLLSIMVFHFPGSVPRCVYSTLSCAPPTAPFDVVFMDQQAFGVPWIKLIGCTRVVFYCHFPDKDISNSIAKQRAIARGQSGPSIFRKFYRLPLDLIEEGTMDYADKILVNSEFTQKHFRKSFFRLRRSPRVLYPGIDTSTYDADKVRVALDKFKAEIGELSASQRAVEDAVTASAGPILISINRFEAKKNVGLALQAFAGARKELADRGNSDAKYRLIVAGGYDRRVGDNIATLDELQKQATQLGLSHRTIFFQDQQTSSQLVDTDTDADASVIFLPSLPGALLNTLLLNASVQALLYTPTDEHFGIVPLEAMACGLPVLATNTGGPMESIVDAGWEQQEAADRTIDGDKRGKFTNLESGTGLLRHPSASIWTGALVSLLGLTSSERAQMGTTARKRVKELFSIEAMTTGLEKALVEAEGFGPVRTEEGLVQWGSGIGVFVCMMSAYVYLIYRQSQAQALQR